MMARLYLIIDGYNLLHAAGRGRRRYGPGEFERARRQLLQKIASGIDETAARDTTIVFDSAQAGPGSEQGPSEQRRFTQHGMTVLYSSDGRDADAEIELLLAVHSSPRQALIVSSDHRLHKAAQRRRARCIDSEEFLQLLENSAAPWARPTGKARRQSEGVATSRAAEGRLPAKKNDSLTLSDNDELLQEFLNIDVEEISRSVRKEKR